MKNNTVAAEMEALSRCRKDGGELFTVVCTRPDGTKWESDTFPKAYAEEFAATERFNSPTYTVEVKPYTHGLLLD